ncbi:MAG: cytochrome c566 [Phormidesmis priestleyi Ana]|uniref:Cytochrome c566 n=1 Tax=Phormidesmis priestleyi Ana TaxID=1666911 RepID=A0A0P7YME5_9CYAN|nr:MAG: cytochrome c566 [Phormidesmis priestleyi Ana]
MRIILRLSIILLIAVITAVSTSTYDEGIASLYRQSNAVSAIDTTPVSPVEVETIIAYRREHMKALSAHYRSLESIINNNAPFDSHVLDHVNALIMLAQHTDETFPTGTTMLESEGWGAKPLIWEEPESFARIINDFQVSLETLQVVITSQNLGSNPVNALDQVRQSCLACHQQYRVRNS